VTVTFVAAPPSARCLTGWSSSLPSTSKHGRHRSSGGQPLADTAAYGADRLRPGWRSPGADSALVDRLDALQAAGHRYRLVLVDPFELGEPPHWEVASARRRRARHQPLRPARRTAGRGWRAAPWLPAGRPMTARANRGNP
jgi:hypothetical protein